jgi:organic radical activating enzyme
MSFLTNLFQQPEPLKPGLYQRIFPEDSPFPYRLHLRIEGDGGVLIVNAATVLHLNSSAAAHAMELIKGSTDEEAATAIASQYRVSRKAALRDHQEFRDQIITLATNPDVDPVVFLGMDRVDPFEKLPLAPYRVDIALTYLCDAEGTLDPLARRRVDRELTPDEWRAIIKKLWDAGIPHITFTGGEPTLRPDLPDLIGYAQELGQVTGLLTTGTKLTDAAFLEQLAQAGLDHILIALDSENSESRAGMLQALATDVFTAVHLTITNQSEAELKALIASLAEDGVPAISLSAQQTHTEPLQKLEAAREHAAQLGLDLIWDLPAPYSETHPISLELDSPTVGAGRAWLYIEPDGDVLPSQGVDRVLGNLLREEWSTIWSVAST